ncbi:MAG TPA: type VI secretion system tube protein Hcp [Chloroflexota bacterium]
MAFDCFLKIDGVEGESRDARHAREIDVLSFSWGESNTGAAAHGGGGGAGKVSMQDFHFTMKLNKASPLLAAACATGQHIKSAVLTCRKAGATGGDLVGLSALPQVVDVPGGVDVVPLDQPVAVAGDGFIKFALTDLLVSSYKTSAGPQPHLSTDQAPAAGGADLPTDAVALNFARIEIEVRGQRVDGSLGSSVKAGFDRRKGVKA